MQRTKNRKDNLEQKVERRMRKKEKEGRGREIERRRRIRRKWRRMCGVGGEGKWARRSSSPLLPQMREI